MSLFQILMIAMAAFFSFKVYSHIQTLEDKSPNEDENNKGSASYDPQMLVKRADEAFVKGDLKQAFFLLDEANVKVQNNADILGKLGFISAKEGHINEAISYYQEALHVDQKNDIFHNAIASLYRKIKEYDKAQEHYKQALAIDPNYAISYFNYANLLVDMQQYIAAKEMYEKALQINPEFTEARDEIEILRNKI